MAYHLMKSSDRKTKSITTWCGLTIPKKQNNGWFKCSKCKKHRDRHEEMRDLERQVHTNIRAMADHIANHNPMPF